MDDSLYNQPSCPISTIYRVKSGLLLPFTISVSDCQFRLTRKEMGNSRSFTPNLCFFLRYHRIRFAILFLNILSIWESNRPISRRSRWSDPLLISPSPLFIGMRRTVSRCLDTLFWCSVIWSSVISCPSSCEGSFHIGAALYLGSGPTAS